MNTTMTTPTEARHSGGMEEVPDPQVPPKARRRRYSASYKAEILAEYEAADREGRGALLRREGLYTSLISAWRDQRDRGAKEALGRSGGGGRHRQRRPRRKPPGCGRRTSGCGRIWTRPRR